MEEFFDDKHLKKGRCDGCEFCKQIYANGGWGFFACYHQPYQGKWVVTIKDCPKVNEKDVIQ